MSGFPPLNKEEQEVLELIREKGYQNVLYYLELDNELTKNPVREPSFVDAIVHLYQKKGRAASDLFAYRRVAIAQSNAQQALEDMHEYWKRTKEKEKLE